MDAINFQQKTLTDFNTCYLDMFMHKLQFNMN